jgi:antitoxin (DNA-binding transcriptional repressor) of toxin-antitoxin stability system
MLIERSPPAALRPGRPVNRMKEGPAMTTVTIEEAQARLSELISGLSGGEEVAVTQGGRVVARIVGERAEVRQRPGPGLGKGMLTVVADDDEHLKDFAEYMP